MKSRRQEKIIELICQESIDTQNALADALRAAGFASTQATISRDIRELGLVKEMGSDGRYRYIAPRQASTVGYSERLRTIFKESVTSIEAAQNMVVLKTLPGLASAACSAIDDMAYPDLLGTLAGDDTAFIAMRDAATAERFTQEISSML